MSKESPYPPLRRYWPVWPLLAIILLVLFWDWNWFKPLVERQASAAVARKVTINDLDVHLSWHPEVILQGITLANPEDFETSAVPLATVSSLAVRFGIRDLFDHRVQISQLDIDKPLATLRTGHKGLRNWQFTLPPADPNADKSKPWDVQIAGLVIRDGQFSIVDPVLKVDVKGAVHTGEPGASGEAPLIAAAEGLYNKAPFKARFVGDSVLSLRTPENPYPVDLGAESGDTRIALKGSLLDPMQFGGAKLKLLLQGSNLSALADLLQLPLPNTPPYKLEGLLDYRAQSILFNDFAGQMGESDVAGYISVRLQQPRPLLEAKLLSKQVRLEDLSGLIGGDPNAPAADAPGGDGKLLPATPINVPKLQTADVRLDFTGNKIVGDKLPFDRLAFKLTIDDGVLRASPVDLGIGEGSLRLYATIDPRGDLLGIEAKADLHRVDVSRLMQKTGYKGSGRIGGSAALTSKGHSAAELFGNGDGQLKLAMAGGDFSALLLDLSGLDFGNALLSAIGVGSRTEVRCMVGDFALEKGQFDTKSFVLDTGNTNLLLTGGADFKTEKLDFNLRTQPKRANFGRLKAPIHIKGTFADPSVLPDFVDLGVRTGAAVALGVLLTPLAAILPTLQLGPGEDRDCLALLAEADATAPPQPAKP